MTSILSHQARVARSLTFVTKGIKNPYRSLQLQEAQRLYVNEVRHKVAFSDQWTYSDL